MDLSASTWADATGAMIGMARAAADTGIKNLNNLGVLNMCFLPACLLVSLLS
jgi:hypothetical protein